MPRELVALDVRKPALRDYEDSPVPEGHVRVKVEFGSPKRGTELTLYRGDRMPGFPMGLGNMCVGRITDVTLDPSDKYDDQIVIKIDDGEEVCYLRSTLGSGYTKSFMKIAPNINYEKQVELVTTMDTTDDRKKTAILIKQPEGRDVTDKGWVRPYFTREHMNGMPEATKNARDEWDFVEQDVFLEKYLFTKIVPYIKALNADGSLPPSDEIPVEPEKEKPLVTKTGERPSDVPPPTMKDAPPEEEDDGLPF